MAKQHCCLVALALCAFMACIDNTVSFGITTSLPSKFSVTSALKSLSNNNNNNNISTPPVDSLRTTLLETVACIDIRDDIRRHIIRLNYLILGISSEEKCKSTAVAEMMAEVNSLNKTTMRSQNCTGRPEMDADKNTMSSSDVDSMWSNISAAELTSILTLQKLIVHRGVIEETESAGTSIHPAIGDAQHAHSPVGIYREISNIMSRHDDPMDLEKLHVFWSSLVGALDRLDVAHRCHQSNDSDVMVQYNETLTSARDAISVINAHVHRLRNNQLQLELELADLEQRLKFMHADLHLTPRERTAEPVNETSSKSDAISTRPMYSTEQVKEGSVGTTFTSLLAAKQHRLASSPPSVMHHYATQHDVCNGERKHLVGSSCYLVPRIVAAQTNGLLYSWWDARYVCKRPENLGPRADLVSIGTQDEMTAIERLLANHFGGIDEFWLGASDLNTTGVWTWASTGEPLTELRRSTLSTAPEGWHEGPGGKHCLSMLQGYVWTAEPCYFERYPLCELILDI